MFPYICFSYRFFFLVFVIISYALLPSFYVVITKSVKHEPCFGLEIWGCMVQLSETLNSVFEVIVLEKENYKEDTGYAINTSFC